MLVSSQRPRCIAPCRARAPIPPAPHNSKKRHRKKRGATEATPRRENSAPPRHASGPMFRLAVAHSRNRMGNLLSAAARADEPRASPLDALPSTKVLIHQSDDQVAAEFGKPGPPGQRITGHGLAPKTRGTPDLSSMRRYCSTMPTRCATSSCCARRPLRYCWLACDVRPTTWKTRFSRHRSSDLMMYPRSSVTPP